MSNSYLNELSKVDPWENLWRFTVRLTKPVLELWDGITKKTLPWKRLVATCLMLELILFFRVDLWCLKHTKYLWLYPRTMSWYHVYYFLVISSPYTAWGVFQARKRERLNKKLEEIFKSTGLQNNLGNLPTYVFDRPLDSVVRKLRVTRAALPMSAFQKAKDGLQGGIEATIDEFRENLAEGTVDIIYAKEPMPALCKIASYGNLPSPKFYVGRTRSKTVIGSLDATPHLLVAGQTGGGKSTFIRQFTVTLYLGDKTTTFTFIDFKGTVEAEIFEKLRRIDVPKDMTKAIISLKKAAKTLDYRLRVLKANRCKDIGGYFKIPVEKRVVVPPDDVTIKTDLNRHIIIVDEAAELFLAGEKGAASDVQEAKRILSLISRQGRSIGVHLVLATQRPDSRVLDPQIKSNLTGVLCFQMINDPSSILVLGNGRATDLPSIPGRAIWRSGMDLVELQTPFLDWKETIELLQKDYVEPKLEEPSQVVVEPDPGKNIKSTESMGE